MSHRVASGHPCGQDYSGAAKHASKSEKSSMSESTSVGKTIADVIMSTGSNVEKRQADVTGEALEFTRREQLLAQARLTRSFAPVVQRDAVRKLVLESVWSGACTPAEILEAAYDDPHGYRYWELWLFEPVQIYQFAELVALDTAGTDGVRALDRYLMEIFERLRAAAEAGETWFIGDTSPLITETWSSSALRNSTLAVRPREAIAWMCQNPNARHLVPGTPAEIAGSTVSVNSPATASALPVWGSVAHTSAQGRGAVAQRRRGRSAIKLEQTKEKMRQDILEGRKTAKTLSDMLEKHLSSSYGVSRDTARKARNEVLSELGAN